MTVSVNLQWIEGLAEVVHLADHHSVTISAHDSQGSEVTLFFADDDGTSELAVAEAWLRDALAKVEVAKIDAANDQPAPVRVAVLGAPGVASAALFDAVNAARIGEPLDLTAGAL